MAWPARTNSERTEAAQNTHLWCDQWNPAWLPTEQPIDTSTAAGKAFLDMLGVFTEFEANLRRERQLEGIGEAKKAGVYKGGKPRIDREAVHSLHRDGKGPTEIAKALGISRMHAYRLIKAMEPVA